MTDGLTIYLAVGVTYLAVAICWDVSTHYNTRRKHHCPGNCPGAVRHVLRRWFPWVAPLSILIWPVPFLAAIVMGVAWLLGRIFPTRRAG